MSTHSLTAAQTARRDAALSKRYRSATGRIYTLGETIDAGEYAYRVREVADGKTTYALITRENALAAIADEDKFGAESYYSRYGYKRAVALHFANQTVAPKFAFDYADTLPILDVETSGGRLVSFNLDGGAYGPLA